MRTVLLLFAMLPFLAVGCGDANVAVNESNAPAGADSTPAAEAMEEIKLDYVDAAGLEATAAANSLTLVDFTAKW